MIMLIDNYDSFSYNLYQMIGEIEPDIRVIRNDEMSVDEIMDMCPQKIIISPGPGRPEQAGNIMDVAKVIGIEIPVLGVCLGHQAICAAFGATVTYANKLMHGKQSVAELDTSSDLFEGCPKKTPVARYHSLIVDPETIPEELKIIAMTEGEIMGVKHKDHPVYGVQFHPESILTPCGKMMLENFIQKI